jgi:Transglutaminase-like superfamily
MDHDYWASQSRVTDPGAAAGALDDLPADLRSLREASSQLVFHYRAGGDFAANGVPAERVSEINTMYARDLLALVLGRGEPSLARRRPGADRVVGCCRDSTVLFLALARHKGIPARARVGFAAYFQPGWMLDHVVAEVWDGAEERWRLVDAETPGGWTPEVNGQPVDWLDLTGDQFVTGPRAWQAARDGRADPERYVVAPDLDLPFLRGWTYLAHNALHDLATLTKTEMLLWDEWGLQVGQGDGPITAADAAVLDEVCALTADPAADPAALTALAARDGLRVPPVVARFDPVSEGPPSEVDVSAALPVPAGGAPTAS